MEDPKNGLSVEILYSKVKSTTLVTQSILNVGSCFLWWLDKKGICLSNLPLSSREIQFSIFSIIPRKTKFNAPSSK